MMEKQFLWPRVATTLCACAVASVLNSARAENTAGDTATLDEVVVTAQRQEENLQKTPIAVTAITSDEFDKLGNGNVATLTMIAPSLQVSNNGGGGALIGIRGIITGNGTDVGDPAVAFETDGLYHARSQTQGSTLFDIDHIEVLRGPQGTLYGRNATTGVVNVISKKPGQKSEAQGYIEAGNYRSLNAFGAINVPISDAVAVRGAFVSVNHDPIYNNNLGRAQDYGDLHETAARLTGLINATDNVSILLRGAYDQITGNGPPQSVPIPLSADPYTFNVNGQGTVNSQQFTGQAVMDWKLPFATLTYEAGYHKSDGFARISSSGPTVLANPTSSNTQQHELRISNATDKFKYVAGVFYFDESQVWMIYVDPFIRFLMPDESQDSKAAFGQATYSITDALRLTAGLRYTQDHKTRTGGNFTLNVPAGSPPGTLPYWNDVGAHNFADISSSKTTYKVGVDYDIAAESLLYTSVATGYKQGGFFDGDQTKRDNTYKPENVLSFEVGYKSRFLDNRLQLNVAAFNYKYTDFQVSYREALPSLITRTYNAQEAKNTGLEIELEAAPSLNDHLGLSVTWLHARYAQFDIPNGPDAYGRFSYSGNSLPYAPDYGVNAQWDHTWSLANNSTITFGVLSHWQSATYLEFHDFAPSKQDAYSKTDLNLTWGEVKGHYSVTAFVRNVENKTVLVSASLPGAVQPAGGGYAPIPTTGTGSLGQPRTFGVRMNFSL
jgi:iron complex outermembrane recepter protein